MGRVKKSKQTTDDNVVVEEVNPGSKPADVTNKAVTKKPAQGFKGNINAHAKYHPVRDMVTSALRAKASEDGVPLATIRTYIMSNYNNKKKLSMAIQKQIKDYIAGEFDKGTIVASNTTDKDIKFNMMRFNMADK